MVKWLMKKSQVMDGLANENNKGKNAEDNRLMTFF